MDTHKDNFSSSPLVIASRKARWIFDGLDTGETNSIVLLAQAMATLVHGYSACDALPSCGNYTIEDLYQLHTNSHIDKVGNINTLSLTIIVAGHSFVKQNILSSHSGNIAIICGNNVTLENVTFEGMGKRNLIVICSGATLSNVTFQLDGMGLVVIGANSTIINSQFTTSENVGPDCVLFKSLVVFPGEHVLDSLVNKIRTRRWPTVQLNESSILTNESDTSNIAEVFSRALSNQFSESLRAMEDTKEFRRELMAKDELFHQMKLIHNKDFATKNFSHSDISRPRVACIMMQRNERTLLRPWVEYYSDLFGSDNLFIFDNGSTDEDVRTYLQKIKMERGIHVDFSHQSSVDFRRKGVIFQKLIKELEAMGYYDLFLPLDCDEFISVLVRDNVEQKFSLDNDSIYRELRRYTYNSHALKVKTFFNNMPHKVDTFYEQKGEKTFFTANSIASLDHGFHNGKTDSGKELVTNITYVHFHNKPLEELKEHAYNKLAPMLDIDDESVLNELLEQKNRLALNLMETKASYERRFESKEALFNNELNQRLKSKGILFTME